MTAQILICVPCRDRQRVVAQCLPTVVAGAGPQDEIFCTDDASTEYDGHYLLEWATSVRTLKEKVGPSAQRQIHFREFSAGFTHLYLTDSDAIHDPDWRSRALFLQERHAGAPVCLYNAWTHADKFIKDNTVEDDPLSEVIVRRYAPGISYFLSRAHVEKVLPHLAHMNHWDWNVPDWLGNRMAVSRVSYVDHIALGGMHHKPEDGFEGDRGLNPTPWLAAKRAEVVAALAKES
jgi:Glycosyl transferase family 2